MSKHPGASPFSVAIERKPLPAKADHRRLAVLAVCAAAADAPDAAELLQALDLHPWEGR